jgi:hypothetical protein
MTVLQDFDLIETATSELIQFEEGQPITATKVEGKMSFTIVAVELPNGPVAPYQVFSGSWIAILGMAFADGMAFASGSPISIAEKIKDKWYGETITGTPIA